MRLSAEEKKARTVKCEFCGARPGFPCVYTDGVFRGEQRASGAHGTRGVAAHDAEIAAGASKEGKA